MAIKETRILNWHDLRNLCVDNNWYTYGDNEAYKNILDFASANEMTTENLVYIANDIIEHSNPKCFAFCEDNGTTALKYVLFELADACNTFFHDKDEDFINGTRKEME